QHQRIVVPPTSTMKENPLQYRVRGTPVPTTRTRGTNYPKSTVEEEIHEDLEADEELEYDREDPDPSVVFVEHTKPEVPK
ncbi:hypothetical protein ACL1IE_02670, partial [Corynebacterium striatum]